MAAPLRQIRRDLEYRPTIRGWAWARGTATGRRGTCRGNLDQAACCGIGSGSSFGFPPASTLFTISSQADDPTWWHRSSAAAISRRDRDRAPPSRRLWRPPAQADSSCRRTYSRLAPRYLDDRQDEAGARLGDIGWLLPELARLIDRVATETATVTADGALRATVHHSRPDTGERAAGTSRAREPPQPGRCGGLGGHRFALTIVADARAGTPSHAGVFFSATALFLLATNSGSSAPAPAWSTSSHVRAPAAR